MAKIFPLFKRKNVFLAIFVILAKARKWPKISFYFFDLVKKNWQKWKMGTFLHGPFFQLFPIFAYFFWPNQKVYYMKNVGLPKWLRCAKKISTFKNKKWFFGNFCDFLAHKCQKYLIFAYFFDQTKKCKTWKMLVFPYD